jgi:hypothetical protein
MIPGTDEYRFNFWGYSTVNFFSPMARYSQVIEFLLTQIVCNALPTRLILTGNPSPHSV